MIKAFFKGLLGGGSSYIYLIAIGGVFAFWVHHKNVVEARDRYKTERDNALAEVVAKDETIASQARTSARRSQSAAQQTSTEEAINAVPDATHCAASEPIIVALDLLRERSDAESTDNPDE